MKLDIPYQEDYSRTQLLLRTFFGFFYIALPHGFLLMIFGIWSAILTFLAAMIIFFTGRYPTSFFEYQVKYTSWGMRVVASMLNLVDGYPAFFINSSDSSVMFKMDIPESLDRFHLLFKIFLGFLYCGLPHYFILYFRGMITALFAFIAWFCVLFTGRYPKTMHEFNVGTLRWGLRVHLYLTYMTDTYPPFSGVDYGTDDERREPTQPPKILPYSPS